LNQSIQLVDHEGLSVSIQPNHLIHLKNINNLKLLLNQSHITKSYR